MKSSFFSAVFLAASVSAHGIVTQVTIGSKAFKGNIPNSTPVGSPIRLVTSGDPVKGATNPNINCGNNATKASQVASAMPGDKVLVKWNGEDGVANWPHNTGPMLTYLASCGSTSCDKFDSTTAKWFKIDQLGRKTTGDKPWVQADLMTGTPANVTLPANLAPGGYILRHEIIALHLAETVGGAEFYPSCSQINVGGSGTGKPTDDEFVSLPGAYKDTDPGIFYKDAFDPTAPYTFPGPSIAKFVTEPANSSNGSSSSATSSTSATASPGSTSASSKTCKKKSNSSSSSAATVSSTASASANTAAAAANAAAVTSPTATVISLVAASASSSSPSSAASPTATEAGSGYGYAKRSIQSQPRHVSRIMRGAHGLSFQTYGRM